MAISWKLGMNSSFWKMGSLQLRGGKQFRFKEKQSSRFSIFLAAQKLAAEFIDQVREKIDFGHVLLQATRDTTTVPRRVLLWNSSQNNHVNKTWKLFFSGEFTFEIWIFCLRFEYRINWKILNIWLSINLWVFDEKLLFKRNLWVKNWDF